MKIIKKQLIVVMALIIGLFVFSNRVMAADVVANGSTGAQENNLTWSLDNSGVLTISGTGAMEDERIAYSRPWDEFAENITKIIITEGVTSIGNRSFCELKNVVSVEMADTVVRIGEEAFYYCTKLKEIKFPENNLTIEKYAFISCTSLESITLPEKLQVVKKMAFNYCQKLKVVLWKGTNVEIVDYPFSDCHYELTFYALKEGKVKKYAEEEEIEFRLITDLKVKDLYINPDLGQTYATLTWTSPEVITGHKIYKYNSTDKKYELVEKLQGDVKKYKVSKLKTGTSYRYKIIPFVNIAGIEYEGIESQIKFRTRSSSTAISEKNDKIAAGFVGTVKTVAKNYSEMSADTSAGCYERWASASDISQFTDDKGNYCIAYSDKNSKYIYIRAYNKDLEQVYSRKIKQLYPLLGGVECDEDGNFFVVWGKEDTKSSPGAETMAISKYKKNGDFVKTTKFKTQYLNDTKKPFDAGNCDIAIGGELLVCNYAREMYNGHQSNGLLQINTKTMKALDIYDTYSSHSFDQRVLFDREGVAWFVSHGDCYPRAFSVDTSGGEKEANFEPFHFYADEAALNNMMVLNVTNARLGGVVDTSSGLVLAGSSVKSMKKSGYNSQVKNLFVMYVDPEKQMPDGTSRSGICKGKSEKDTGVKWLTNNTGVDADNVQMVYTDDDRIVLLWESFKNGAHSNTWYMILSSNGKIQQKATKLRNVELNAFEDPIYKDGYIYWSTYTDYGEDQKFRNHRLSLKMLTYDKDKLTVEDLKGTKTSKKITLKWKKNSAADGYVVYKHNGESYKKVKSVKSNTYTLNGLAANKNYKLAVKAYKKIDGTTYYGSMKYLKVKTSK